MQTPSHFLMTATLAKVYPNLSLANLPMVRGGFLWGSIAPDLALWFLSLGGAAYYHWQGLSLKETAALMFDKLYFHDPFWIVSHNLLHAPMVLAIGLLWSWRSHRAWWFWFFLACLFHTTIDILTHVDDGPLIFFPLDWSTRFHSVVSYYDDRYYGREFSIFENGIDLFFLIYLLYSPITRYIHNLIQKFNQ
jgi:hypothetical protein